MSIDFPDTVWFGFRGDEHDDFQVAGFGCRTEVVHIFPEREVGDDDAINATLSAILTEPFKAVLQDGVQVTHQYEGNVDAGTYVA